jgi:hypothetical protein
LGETSHRLRIAPLALRNPEEGFLVAVIALNLPAIDVSLQEGFQIQLRVGANQKGGLTVEKLGTLAEAIAEGFDDQQA